MPARKPSTNSRPHRRLVVAPHWRDASDLQQGADVEALQRAVNLRIQRNHLPIRPLVIDGECGRQTVAAARRVARYLGIGLRDGVHGVTRYVQNLIRHPRLRTPAQRRRGKRYREAHHDPGVVTVTNNTATGGTPRERVVACALKAADLYYRGKSHRFYSQPGAWTVDHAITGETPGRDRSDCSQFATGIHHAAGAKDPNANNYHGGYTGTLGANAKYIRRDQLRPGDLVLYGPAPHHHVEIYVGPGNRTVGHGSPPVDFGDIWMLADPHFATYDL